MFIPLGLFLRLKHIPFVTIIIVLLCAINHFFISNYKSDMPSLTENVKNIQYLNSSNYLFSKYCLSKGLSEKQCPYKEIEPPKLKVYIDGKLIKSKHEIEKEKIENTKENAPNKLTPEQEINYHKALEFISSFDSSYKYTKEFKQIIRGKVTNTSPLSQLEGFSEFKKLHNEMIDKRIKFYKKHDLLYAENINVLSILKAMFSHANIPHLIGNMFALIVFGIYVEARIGALNYSIAYILGGAVGLGLHIALSSDKYVFIVGASANVFAVMGMFYVFFRNFPMKFFIFYFYIKIVKIPVRKYFFIFFILLELILIFSDSTNVAHGAHVLGLAFGMIFAYSWNKINRLPDTFLYKDELEWWNKLKNSKNLKATILQASNMLSYNPYNNIIRGKVFNLVFEESIVSPTVLTEHNAFIQSELTYYLKYVHSNEGDDKCIQILERLSTDFNLNTILRVFSIIDLISLLDRSMSMKHYFLSLRIISVVCEKYRNSKQIKNFVKTGNSILNGQQFENSQIKHIIHTSSNKEYITMLNNHLKTERINENF